MKKQNIAVVFGGVSVEYDVSCSTGKNVIEGLDRERYNVYPVGITKDGRWVLFEGDTEMLKNDTWENASTPAHIAPDRGIHGMVTELGNIYIDCAFIALHGKNGEDGTIQGLFELAGIPYCGPKVLASAVCMDKVASKQILAQNGIASLPFDTVSVLDMQDEGTVKIRIEKKFTYPMFVKPVNGGSTIGAKSVHNESELLPTIKESLAYDSRIMVEPFVDAMECEVGVIGNNEIIVSPVGEIVMHSEFYDYDTKYTQGAASLRVPANLSEEELEYVAQTAKKAYIVLGLSGYCRIDFFKDRKSGNMILNEINTLPGLTATSGFPRFYAEMGYAFPKLLDKLIEYAYDTKEDIWTKEQSAFLTQA